MIDLSKYDEIIIWGASFPQEGAGNDATSHGRAIESLYKLLMEHAYWDKVVCIVDSNNLLYGKKRLEIPIMNPAVILEHPDALVIINTISIKAVQNAMDKMRAKNDYVIIPYYYYHGTLEHIYQNETAQKDAVENEFEIRKLYCMDDAYTKRYLDIILSMRKKGEDDLYTADYYEGTGENLDYFCDSELAPEGEATYIDVGAYNGNSIEPVLKFYGDNIKKYFAFEPDKRSIPLLEEYTVRRYINGKTQIFPYALGPENKKIRFLSSGFFSIVSERGESILEQKIFDELPDINIVGDAMVKMDIEGAELGALMGMSSFIKEHQPYLAICLYHKEKDLYEIADYIKSLNPEYRLYLRGGWHLECWAVPQRHFERKEAL